ncbi:prepilin-type N-terminal cleavage/methylation domain-containing protein [Gammaproteobacteria bacterium]|nr:prepilin-type N-terminal cleavage/methylation domain-containing protein [Gammaproteobacteria bacterium]
MKNLPGFTLLELLIVMALIALTSTIVLTNASFLDRYNSDQIPSYEYFLKYLNEESSLKKKKVAWFVGDQSQSARILVNNEWEILPLEKDFFPVVNLDVVFKDFSGSSFNINDDRAEPFIIFDPIGKSSGASIEFYNQDIEMILTVDQFSKITYQSLK